MYGLISLISIITLMIIENRAPWLARSFALSRYNHRAVIITLKASSFQNGSQIFWCFGVGNLSTILFSRIIINVIILIADIHVAWDDLLLNSIFNTRKEKEKRENSSLDLIFLFNIWANIHCDFVFLQTSAGYLLFYTSFDFQPPKHLFRS